LEVVDVVRRTCELEPPAVAPRRLLVSEELMAKARGRDRSPALDFFCFFVLYDVG